MEMYFEQPASHWEETWPIGNSQLGGMIWGDILKEKIGLNDECLWSGYPYDKNNGKAQSYLKEIRENIFQEKNPEAEEIASRYFTGNYTESYLPLGNLMIEEIPHVMDFTLNDVKKYKRLLNLEDACVKIIYETKHNTYQREFFASYPDAGIYGRYESKKRTSYKLFLETEIKNDIKKNAEKQKLIIDLQVPEHVDPNYLFDAKNPMIQGTKGAHHFFEIELLETDGQVSLNDCAIEITSCTFFTFVFKRKKALAVAYSKAKKRHIKDYTSLYNRVDFYLGEQIDLSIDQRIENLRKGAKDPGLFALYFQYGRYLLISSSRKGGLPANLQGIWNWQMRAPWSSNYTTNINLEMNYWSADMCHLKECFDPYSEFIKKISKNGQQTAMKHYQARGFVVHHNSDIWGTTNPVGRRYQANIGDERTSSWAMWNMAGCWFAADLFRHYEYTEDKAFLVHTVWPVLKENALFLCDYLVKKEGVYHSVPSSSPENVFFNDQGKASSLTYSSTMDLCLIKETLNFYLKTCQLLEENSVEEKKIKDILTHLPEIKLGKNGQILEWQKEYKEVKPGHRHVSHLYGLFPGNIYVSQKMKEAAKKSLELRMANGGGYTGWSNAWVANLFVKLGEKEKAYERLEEALCKASYPNLWSKHPPFQIDGNLGILSAFIQMCVQVDENNNLLLLPALPKEFMKKGHLKGACLPGNRKIDLYWEDGTIKDYKIWT